MLRRIASVFTLLATLTSPLLAETMTLGGSRPAPLLLPANIGADQKIPLIVFLHGYTSSAQQMDEIFGMSKQRDALGFAIMLPDGTKNSKGERFWNATPECCDDENSGIDDAGYLAGLIQEAEQVAPIDPNRVYLMGHSNGGFMSYRMACDYPQLIKGLVSIAGAFFKNPDLCKKPADALNILQIHGTLDLIVPIDGSEWIQSAQKSLDFWIAKGQCGSPLQKTGAYDLVSPITDPLNLKETDSIVWSDCHGGSKVGLWKINGTGHMPLFNSTWLGEALKFLQ